MLCKAKAPSHIQGDVSTPFICIAFLEIAIYTNPLCKARIHALFCGVIFVHILLKFLFGHHFFNLFFILNLVSVPMTCDHYRDGVMDDGR